MQRWFNQVGWLVGGFLPLVDFYTISFYQNGGRTLCDLKNSTIGHLEVMAAFKALHIPVRDELAASSSSIGEELGFSMNTTYYHSYLLLSPIHFHTTSYMLHYNCTDYIFRHIPDLESSGIFHARTHSNNTESGKTLDNEAKSSALYSLQSR